MNEKFDFECKPKNTISMHVVEGVTKTSKRHGFLWLKKEKVFYEEC